MLLLVVRLPTTEKTSNQLACKSTYTSATMAAASMRALSTK